MSPVSAGPNLCVSPTECLVLAYRPTDNVVFQSKRVNGLTLGIWKIDGTGCVKATPFERSGDKGANGPYPEAGSPPAGGDKAKMCKVSANLFLH